MTDLVYTPDLVAAVTFDTEDGGYRRRDVDAFHAALAQQMSSASPDDDRVADTANHPGTGQEAEQLVAEARAEATEIVARAHDDAAALLTQAHTEADDLVQAAREEVDDLLRNARLEADRLVQAAHDEAAEICEKDRHAHAETTAGVPDRDTVADIVASMSAAHETLARELERLAGLPAHAPVAANDKDALGAATPATFVADPHASADVEDSGGYGF